MRHYFTSARTDSDGTESESEVAQSCPTVCHPMHGNLPGSAVHGIFQARILERAAISFSRGSSQPKDRTRVSCIADRRFTVWAAATAVWYWVVAEYGVKLNMCLYCDAAVLLIGSNMKAWPQTDMYEKVCVNKGINDL